MSSSKQVYSKWIKRGKNTFLPTDNSEIKPQVDAGYYDIRWADGIGYYLLKREFFLDDLLIFPSNIHRRILDSINDFWKQKQKFKEYGFAFKRGILLHGKAGSGKTCVINLAIKHSIEEQNGIVLSLSSGHDLESYAQFMPEIFRVIEPSRPVIIVIEDIENLCYGDIESKLLNVLDGLDQLENVVYLATTNYIEHLKERIINRPSRFDRRIYVPFLSDEDRKFYFEKKLKDADLKGIDIDQWVADTKDMSIAHLSELIKSVVIMDNPYEEIIEILKEMNQTKNLHSSGYEKPQKSLGFSAGNSSGGFTKRILTEDGEKMGRELPKE